MLTIRRPFVAVVFRRAYSACGAIIWSGVLLGLGSGCTSTKTTNTARTGTEQLLISNAVDQSLSKVDFRTVAGKRVLVEEKYLDSIDKGYVASTVRHHVLQAGGSLATKPEEADLILEIRSGGIGTDTSDSFIGVPGISLPGMLTLPDVKIVTRTRQSAYAKLGLVAIDAKTHQVLGDGGTTLSMSDDNKWYVMGVGPYEDGSMKREVQSSINNGWNTGSGPIPNSVAFSSPATSNGRDTGTSRVQLTAEAQPAEAPGEVSRVDLK
jgi:hypothetical protein